MNNMVLLAAEAFKEPWLPLFSIEPTTIIFTLINTGIIVFLYARFLHKPVQNMLEKRKEAIKAELDAAAEANANAAAAEKEYLELLSNSKAEASKIIAAANAKARTLEEEIVAEAKESAVQIRQKATDEIERERKRAVNEIKNQITEIVIMAAGAVAEKDLNESDHTALIESFLVNAGD